MRKLKLNVETLRVLTDPAASPEAARGAAQVGTSRQATVCGCTEPITV